MPINTRFFFENSSADIIPPDHCQSMLVDTSQDEAPALILDKDEREKPKPTWQKKDDKAQIEHRKLTIAAIMMMMREYKGSNASKAWLQQLPTMAKKLELRLYRSAQSFEEYVDDTTLRRRMWTAAHRVKQQYEMKQRSKFFASQMKLMKEKQNGKL